MQYLYIVTGIILEGHSWGSSLWPAIFITH